jgi:uncharacterized protein
MRAAGVRLHRRTADHSWVPVPSVRPFIVCIHDATPAFARETRLLLRDLAPLVGRRLSFGVVPDWHGAWPLGAHTDYCRLVSDSAGELLLHGYQHRRQRGSGLVSWLTARSDEMNGLDPEQTRRRLECGQRVFTEAFGEPARGFLAPAWQPGHVRPIIATSRSSGARAMVGSDAASRDSGAATGIDHVVGFFAVESTTGERVPLTTWTWDCGRWGWLGHVGHGIGCTLHALDRAVPVLAIHPRDLERGYWPKILRLIRELLDAGREPCTAADLLRPVGC